MGKLRFFWMDVFAEGRFKGNQLAVFPSAERLGSEEMQMIAKEMNLSETAFITGTVKDHAGNESFSTRIFTTEEELPFAGHPTLGASFLLKTLHGGNTITLDLKVGPITVYFQERDGRLYGEMRQIDPTFGSIHERNRIAGIFRVSPDEIEDEYPIQTVSTGNPFIIVPFKRLSVLEAIKPDFAEMESYLEDTDAKFFYNISRETSRSEAIAHARMIFHGGEDPATGSAAGPAAAWLLKNGLMKPGEINRIEQGIEMGRPSIIHISGAMKGGNPVDIRVGGFCEMISSGELESP